MKVVFVCAGGIVAGKEIMTLQLLKAFEERGHTCYCITSSWGTPAFKNRLKEMNVAFSAIRIGFISKTLSWPAIRMTLHQAMYIPMMLLDYRAIIKKQNPDVVIHTNFHNLFVYYPAVSTKRKNIYWSHEFAGTSSFYRKLFGLFDKKMNWFVGVSGAIGRSLEMLVPKDKVVVIRNGLKAPVGFQHKIDRKPYPVIGIVGQITDHKGHTVLFNALKDFRSWKQRPSIEIVGDGNPEYIQDLKQLAKDLSIEEIIEWRGFVASPNDIYNGVDFIVVPTKLPDPYPTVVIEAGFRGIPAIVSDSGGLPEMVIPDVNGMIFTTGNKESLASCLASLPGESQYQNWSNATAAHAARHFSVEDFVDRFEELITTGK
jgi:glycosyltransferase involved in cell wall biosynthesis